MLRGQTANQSDRVGASVGKSSFDVGLRWVQLCMIVAEENQELFEWPVCYAPEEIIDVGVKKIGQRQHPIDTISTITPPTMDTCTLPCFPENSEVFLSFSLSLSVCLCTSVCVCPSVCLLLSLSVCLSP